MAYSYGFGQRSRRAGEGPRDRKGQPSKKDLRSAELGPTFQRNFFADLLHCLLGERAPWAPFHGTSPTIGPSEYRIPARQSSGEGLAGALQEASERAWIYSDAGARFQQEFEIPDDGIAMFWSFFASFAQYAVFIYMYTGALASWRPVCTCR